MHEEAPPSSPSVELGISQHHLACAAVHLARHAVVVHRYESTYQPAEMKREGGERKARRVLEEEKEKGTLR